MEDENEDAMDMGDTLSEAYDSATEEPTEQARDESGKFTTDTPEAPETAESDEITDDESEVVDLDNEEDDTTEDHETDETEDATSEPVNPPDSWTTEARERFANLDPETQAYIVQREQEQADGVAKLKETFESKAAVADEFSEIVRPYEAQMRAEGATPTQAVQSLLNTAQILRTGSAAQKEAIIRQTAQQFGVELSATEPDSLDEFVDPDVVALKQQVADLTNFITQQQQTNHAEAERGILSEIQEFAEAKDAKGEALRPHYNAVEGDMIPLIASIRSASPRKSNAEVLVEAYDRAIYANPDTRKLVLEGEAKAAEAKRREDAKKAATEAKKTRNVKGSGIRPGGSPKPSAKPSDWEDDLSEAFDKAS